MDTCDITEETIEQIEFIKKYFFDKRGSRYTNEYVIAVAIDQLYYELTQLPNDV